MTKENLESKLKATKKEFDELETQKQQIIQRQFELRGKYQTYEEQISELESKEDANTIRVKEKINAK